MSRLIIDGNSVYEIDEECERSREARENRKTGGKRRENGICTEEKKEKNK
jgi:hypothetical protein